MLRRNRKCLNSTSRLSQSSELIFFTRKSLKASEVSHIPTHISSCVISIWFLFRFVLFFECWWWWYEIGPFPVRMLLFRMTTISLSSWPVADGVGKRVPPPPFSFHFSTGNEEKKSAWLTNWEMKSAANGSANGQSMAILNGLGENLLCYRANSTRYNSHFNSSSTGNVSHFSNCLTSFRLVLFAFKGDTFPHLI